MTTITNTKITTNEINNLTVPTQTGTLVGTGTNYALNIDPGAAANSVFVNSSGLLINSDSLVYAGGTIDDGTGSGTRGITVGFNNGFVISSPNITVPTTGAYFVSYKQLVSTNSNQNYFSIQKNGATVKFAYSLGNQYNDLGLALIVECEESDYISFHYANSSTNTWQGGHSNWSIWFLGT